MKFSYNWIAELVPGLDATPQELMRLITIKTAECDGVEAFGEHLSQVVAARVIEVEEVAGGHNRKALIDAGPLGRHTVICGAPNCRIGITTAYVPPGTSLAGKRIERRVVDGVESAGMLASAAELGINKDHEGVLELGEIPPGSPLPRLAPDHVIEVDNKSLTHRPDLWGHHGMAREVAAITGAALRDPANLSLLPTDESPVAVSIEDLQLCPRYSALLFENVTVQPSPLWLQQRLQAVGLNPINNIVDVTNFVMAELGQPMHAFDADKLASPAIYVRNAYQDEIFTALNGETYTLTPASLVIADAKGAIALAGVIGGMASAIGPNTTRLLLESANFHAASIRRTSSRLKLRTDASMRFEKSQDPVNTVRGIARAIELLQEVSPGIRIVGGVADAAAPAKPAPVISLRMDWLIRKLGRSIEASEVRHILESLRFEVRDVADGAFEVTVPSWRATKDISIKDDLVEEIGRMVGYATIAPKAPLVPTQPPPDNPRRRHFRALRSLAMAEGYTEIYNYSFVSEETAQRFGMAIEDHIQVANPISADQGLLRRSLIPGIWRNITENSKYFEKFQIFEIGHEIHKEGGPLANEVPHLVAAVYERHGNTGSFYEAKRLAACILPGSEARPATARLHEHPSRAAEIVWRGEVVGRLFEFHPDFVTGRAAALDLDIALIEKIGPLEKRYQPIRRFPSSEFDLSVIAAKRALVGDIQAQIAGFAGPMLENIVFLRQYEGAPLPEASKSVSFQLSVAARDRTLASEEVAAIRDAIIHGMRGLGYDMRV